MVFVFPDYFYIHKSSKLGLLIHGMLAVGLSYKASVMLRCKLIPNRLGLSPEGIEQFIKCIFCSIKMTIGFVSSFSWGAVLVYGFHSLSHPCMPRTMQGPGRIIFWCAAELDLPIFYEDVGICVPQVVILGSFSLVCPLLVWVIGWCCPYRISLEGPSLPILSHSLRRINFHSEAW